MKTYNKKHRFIVILYQYFLALAAILLLTASHQAIDLNKSHHLHPQIILTTAEKAWLKKHPIIRVGVGNNWKPIEFFSESSQFRGISIDYLNHLEQDLGVKFVKYSVDEYPTRDSVDILSAVPYPSRIYGTGFDVLKPYIESPYAIYVHNKNKGINSISDLDGKHVVVYKNSGVIDELTKNHPKVILLKVQLAEEAFDALEFDHAQVYIGNELVVDYHAGIHALDYLRKLGYFPGKSRVSMAVRSDWPELVSILNKSFEALAPQKEHILEAWDIKKQPDKNIYLVFVIAGLLLAGTLLMARAYRLKQTLKEQEKSAKAMMWRQANYDHLTDLPNRMMFNRTLEEKIAGSAQRKTRFALLFLDLDYFKQINDQYGHLVGDQLLVEVAERLKRLLPKDTFVARLGGDEFIVMLPDTQQNQMIQNVADKIISRLCTQFIIQKAHIHITVSIGASIFPDDATNHTDLIKYADQAMYEAKHSGRNQLRAFSNTIREANDMRIHIANDLKKSIKNNELVLHYQPIVSLTTGKVVKAEALLRWQHPKHGLIAPGLFVQIAEETGMIEKIGQWVFEQTLCDLPALKAHYGQKFQVSVNVSACQFGLANHLNTWPTLLAQAGLSGKNICVEITESTLLRDEANVIETLEQLRQAGMMVVIDDFGTGYSSLSYLKKFELDFIKLDASFVRNIESSKHDKILCESITEMAHKLDIQVIAECIETTVQRNILKKIGCDHGQGFLFSRPKPLQELIAPKGAQSDNN